MIGKAYRVRLKRSLQKEENTLILLVHGYKNTGD